ncbi:right-handed parallel beta-helix repeat-containing protein [Spirosoma pomorum]
MDNLSGLTEEQKNIALAFQAVKKDMQALPRVGLAESLAKLSSLERNGMTAVFLQDPNRGGSFAYRPASANLTIDNGTVFGAADGGYWIRPYQGMKLPQWYGAIGDGVTNDQAAINLLFVSLKDGDVVDFGNRTYLFDVVRVPVKKQLTLRNGTLKGRLEIGSSTLTDAAFEYWIQLDDVRFDRSHLTQRDHAIVLSNAKSININKCSFKGVDAAVYVRGFNKMQHVARLTINNCRTEQDLTKVVPNDQLINYLLYVDNERKYQADCTFGIGDVHITNCNDVACRISNVVGWGVDGAQMANNTFFMTGGGYLSTTKKQNVYIWRSNWVSIQNNQLFEPGEEGVLLENSSNYTILNNRIAWPGQRNALQGWGIRVAGKGWPDADYNNGLIANNTTVIPSRGGVWVDEDSANVNVIGNTTLNPGNLSMYYGDATKPQGQGVPAVDPANATAGGWHVNTRRVLFVGNTTDVGSFSFPVDNTKPYSEYFNNRQAHNFEETGSTSTRSGYVVTFAGNTIDVSNAQYVQTNVPAGGSVSSLSGYSVGQVVTIFNGSTPFTLIHNPASLRLKENQNTDVPYEGTITLVRRVGYWVEIGRTYDKPSFKGAVDFATDGVSKQFTVNHNLYIVPSAISLVQIGSGSAGTFAVVERTNTTIKIETSTVIPAGEGLTVSVNLS